MTPEEIRAARGCLAGFALCCLSAVLVVWLVVALVRWAL